MTAAEDHDLLIRIDANLIHLRAWVAQHDDEHKVLRRQMDELRRWKWSWVGAMALGVFLINLLVRYAQ